MLKRLLEALVDAPPSSSTSNETSIEHEQFEYSEDQVILYSQYNVEDKINFELQSIFISDPNPNSTKTPSVFLSFLDTIIGRDISSFNPYITQCVIDESMRNICPYTWKDSKLNRTGVQTSYIKFVCKLHTQKRGCCRSNFTIKIKDNIVQSIELDNIMHNHSMDKLFIESKVTLLTS